MSNTGKDPKGTNKVPTDKGNLRINETSRNNSVQNLTTFTEASSTNLKTALKDESSPYCKRKTNPNSPASDKPMQTDK